MWGILLRKLSELLCWQNIINNRNASSGTTASSDIVVSNNLGTDTTYYGDFGMNSSTFTGAVTENVTLNGTVTVAPVIRRRIIIC